ncbi:MAG: PD-(D/E)XK nuclease family protein, partial [Pseudomonadota bacterium]
AREETRQWHRKGITAAPPARSRAISSLFLPPQASRSWVDLAPDKRQLSGVRLMQSATVEEEAQAIALLVREALEEPGKRVAVISADRTLARRVAQHLDRWQIKADDSAGRALSLTSAGRLIGALAHIAAHGPEPAAVVAALGHPLVRAKDGDQARRDWLRALRRFDRQLRRETLAPGMAPLARTADAAGVDQWWEEAAAMIAPLVEMPRETGLAQAVNCLASCAEMMAGEGAWAREDGRAMAGLIEDVRLHAGVVGTRIAADDLPVIMRDAMDALAVRPPYGGHPRVAIYGLLESRMTRADLIICAGLNEGSWPQAPGPDALLAPGILRALGIPGAEFRIGLAAHDLAGAMGAPQVVLSRAERDTDGPSLPSRFLLRVEALLGELADDHREHRIPAMLGPLDRAPPPTPPYPRPMPCPSAQQRRVKISATALDRLIGDPYQFYAREILALSRLDPLSGDPFGDPALRGTLVHDILDQWHSARRDDPALAIAPFARRKFAEAQVHPLFAGLWQPRLIAAMERFAQMVDQAAQEGRHVIASETGGKAHFDGVLVTGRADRIDRLDDGQLVIVDYKSGRSPSAAQVEQGYALQMGVLGLIARDGAFGNGALSGDVAGYEYWSLAKEKGEFGHVEEPLKTGKKRSGLTLEEFLPEHEAFLRGAIGKYINGAAPFTAKENPDYPGYTEYDQLMRLEEWKIRLSDAVRGDAPDHSGDTSGDTLSESGS